MRNLKSQYLLFILFLFLQVTVSAQDSVLLHWQIFSRKTADSVYEIHLKALIPKGWYVYEKNNQVDGVAGMYFSYRDSSLQKQGALKVNGNKKRINDKIFDNKIADVITDSIEIIQEIKAARVLPPALHFHLTYSIANTESGHAEDDYSFNPEEQELTVALNENGINTSATRILISSIDLKNPVHSCGNMAMEGNIWQIFLWGILGGLLSLFTPCVFPMIPLTVSFFTKKSGSRKRSIQNASLYGFFILLIYVLLSVPFYFLEKGNAEILNNISTNPALNVFFFLIFVFFAFSFFGYYEITLPDKITNSVDSKAGLGHIGGLFFMALTLAIVSFSCTGPLLGSLLVSSLNQNGKPIELTMAMAGFGIAFGLPFALFAMFPNLLNRLPKSGSWLHTFKVILGFIELALAIKFLSNADLVQHWGLLKREIYIGIWIALAILLLLYLIGKIKFPHDSTVLHYSKKRIAAIIITALIIVYLLPGIKHTKYANLALVSGFPPPMYYSIYQTTNDCVMDLNCTHEYAEALEMAKQENKPMLLDFTGYACVNCRRMEENVWSQPEVYRLMRDHFIIVSLYVDDKKSLPFTEQFNYTLADGTQKFISSYGDKWATFEAENFKNNAQPFYAILSKDERLLTNPVGYTPDANEYKEWLLCGLSANEKK